MIDKRVISNKRPNNGRYSTTNITKHYLCNCCLQLYLNNFSLMEVRIGGILIVEVLLYWKVNQIDINDQVAFLVKQTI